MGRTLWTKEIKRLKKLNVIDNSSQNNYIYDVSPLKAKIYSILYMLFCTVWQLELPKNCIHF